MHEAGPCCVSSPSLKGLLGLTLLFMKVPGHAMHVYISIYCSGSYPRRKRGVISPKGSFGYNMKMAVDLGPGLGQC